MSARQVLLLVDALMRDEDYGFVTALEDLILEEDPGRPLQTAIDISRRKPGVTMAPATQPRLAVTLRSWAPALVQPGQKDATVSLDVRYESFEADEETLELQLAYAASAVSKVLLEYLRDYSDANDGTVVEVANPILFQFGEFDGPVSAGFIASVSITERSSE